MQKKPAEKKADSKKIVQTTGEKTTKKVADTKDTLTKTVVVADTNDTIETVGNAVARKAAETKEAEKKTVKKTTVKKASSKKATLVPEVFVQYDNREDVVADVIERAKAAYVANGHKASAIKSLQVYLKPEESTAYYVVNQKYADKIDLF